MDRNCELPSKAGEFLVALRKESVDRNNIKLANIRACILSLSARRAWIEICGGACGRLLALSSLSARRAWIEMPHDTGKIVQNRSLSARRAWIEMIMETPWRYLI